MNSMLTTVEAAFAEGTIAPAFRLRASSPADVFRIQRALDLYCGIIKRTPITEQQVRRPLGSLRTELDRAVAAGDEAEASRLLERIRGVGRLDAENLLYLELGVKAGLGHWREIAEDGALLNQLTGLRLPPQGLGRCPRSPISPACGTERGCQRPESGTRGVPRRWPDTALDPVRHDEDCAVRLS